MYSHLSPSSRRAWIEMCMTRFVTASSFVALLAEGVDRNVWLTFGGGDVTCRPPHGGRG